MVRPYDLRQRVYPVARLQVLVVKGLTFGHNGRMTEATSSTSPAATKARARQPAFAPVRTKRAFEEVCEQVRREVAAGNLRPGDRLPPERELAEQFGVSRAAVREALRSLENSGLVRCQQGMGGGATIRQEHAIAMTQAVSDMIMVGKVPASSVTEARILLTETAIRLACERGTEEDFAAIERDIDRADQLTAAGDFSRRGAYITEFYRVLAQATHNQVIVMLVETLSELTRTLLAAVSPTPRSDVIGVRRKVLQHLRERNADAAVQEMRAHLLRLNKVLEQEATAVAQSERS